ncbi:MAG: 4Fe-4S ferredoxin [Thermodesulfobacteriota bacterium]
MSDITRERIESVISDYMKNPERNAISPGSTEPAFAAPLVGFCRGDDPIFETIKGHIGEFYWTPQEAFQQGFPDLAVSPDQLTVIAWILPQTLKTRKEHRAGKEFPGERWSRVRRYGEQINENLRRHLETRLNEKDIPAVAPSLSPAWERKESPRYGYASTWSERHAAYACGLGTFGLSDGLITPVGKAMRVGSVVARIGLESSGRPYEDHQAYCLHHARNRCGICISRCPAGAISKSGHDKVKCRTYIRQVTRPYVEAHQLGVPVNACGLCQVKVPCESRIPAELVPDTVKTDAPDSGHTHGKETP